METDIQLTTKPVPLVGDHSSPPAADPPDRLASALTAAEDLRRNHRFEEADALLSLAIAQFGEKPDLLIKRAWIAYQKGDFAEALVRWEHLRALMPSNPMGFSAAVSALQKLRRFADADTLSREGMLLFPDNVTIFANHAWTAHHARDWPEAVARWNSVRNRFPKTAIGYQKEAVTLLHMKKYTEAEDVISLGLAVFADDGELLEARAECTKLRPSQNQTALTVLHGGHLFISGDTNFVNQQHDGSFAIAEADKAAWLTILSNRKNTISETCGASFLFLLAPDKQTVYRHLLPECYCVRQAAFLTDLPDTIDVAPLLTNLAKLVDVYPRTDSHWHHLGSHVAAEMVMARLGKSLPALALEWVEQSYVGDLGHKCEPTERSIRLVAKFKPQSSLIYDNGVPNNGRVRIWSKPKLLASKTPSRLLIFGDSFSYDLVHFLKEAFDILVHVHAFAVDFRLVEASQPQHVLCEITERFLVRLPKPGDGEPLTDLWLDKVSRQDRLEPLHGVVAADDAIFPAEAVRVAHVAESLFAPFRARLPREAPTES
jgi:tetratricopeptide (TPR) repeat protein